jgi:hypothetical protein
VTVRGAGGTPGEGPYIVLHLEIDENKIGDGRFESNGCPAAHKAACAVLTVVKGREPSRVALLEPRDLELLAGPLPEGKEMYYDLALAALRECVEKGTEVARP